MSKETVTTSIEEEKTAKYNGGSIEYSLVANYFTLGNPILIVPGFTEGRFVLRDFAESLHQLGGREVILPDQPVFDKKSKLPIVDQHAEALLAIIEEERLGDRPLDVVAHSFGSLVTARAAELAKDRGITSFDAEKGSRVIFIAPSNNPKENIGKLASRWSSFIVGGVAGNKELDPDNKKIKDGIRNARADFWAKTAREVWHLRKKGQLYQKLAELGIKPFIISYAKDRMYTDEVMSGAIAENPGLVEGHAVAVYSYGGIGAKNFVDFKDQSKLSGEAAKRAWAHHYRNASHNDLVHHPKRTAKAVLPILNGNVLQEIKRAASR